MNKTYRLVGTLNLSGREESTIVYPIFKRGEEFYFQDSWDNKKITSFEKVDGMDHLNKIEFLDNKKLLSHPKRRYQVGSKPIIAYQKDKNSVFIGLYKEFIEFYERERKNKIIDLMIHEMENDESEKPLNRRYQ